MTINALPSCLSISGNGADVRVIERGRGLAPLESWQMQQQKLIAHIGGRMKDPGQHCGTSSERRGNFLADSDC
jgi:hypothetical protein